MSVSTRHVKITERAPILSVVTGAVVLKASQVLTAKRTLMNVCKARANTMALALIFQAATAVNVITGTRAQIATGMWMNVKTILVKIMGNVMIPSEAIIVNAQVAIMEKDAKMT